MQALGPNNRLASLKVDASGALIVTGGTGGGGGGDASAANQLTMIGHLDGVETALGLLATQATLAAIQALLPTALVNGRLSVEPLGSAGGVARQLAAGAASANVALTSTTRRISLFARNADVRYSIGSVAQTATSTSGATTSHFLGQGERIELVVPATPNIAVIRAGSTDGTLEITELL